MTKHGHSAHCQHRILGHLRNATSFGVQEKSLLRRYHHPDLKHRLQDYTSLSTPCTILTAGALLGGTEESATQDLITDD